MSAGMEIARLDTLILLEDATSKDRVGYSHSNIPAALGGDIDDLIEKLALYERELINQSYSS